MEKITQAKFTVESVTTPRIDFSFHQTPPNSSFKQGYRVLCEVLGPTSLVVLFGTKLTSEDLTKENVPCVTGLVEVVARLQLSPALPEKVTNVSELPFLGNILAIMYPFIRERLYSCFIQNGLAILLPPVNTMELLKENIHSSSIGLIDNRMLAQDLLTSGDSA